MEFFHDVPPTFDGNPTLWRGPRVATMGGDRDDRGPADGDPGDRDPHDLRGPRDLLPST